MYTTIYTFTEACLIWTHYMYSVCVDKDQSRLEQLEVSLCFIVSLNFQTVSVLQSVEVQQKFFLYFTIFSVKTV